MTAPRKIANSAKVGRGHFLSPSKIFLQFKSSSVPEGGWTLEEFRGPAGVALVRDQLNVQRMAKIKGARMLTKPLTDLMREQVMTVLSIFESRYLRTAGQSVAARRSADAPDTKRPVTNVITVSQHGELWAQAIEEAFARNGMSVSATVRPALQSVADDVLEKTTSLLTGTLPSAAAKRVISTEVNHIATQVTNINTTTRKNLASVIGKAIDEGKHPFEVMDIVREKIPQIATNRVPTIVRTEMGLVADRAAIRSMKESNVVTHVSVTGCEAIEKGIPTWNGIPTCNIRNVPIESAGDLRFHINHTGAIVSSVFRKRDGTVQPTPTQHGPGGIGTWEDRGKPVPAIVQDSPPPKPATPISVPPALMVPPKPPKTPPINLPDISPIKPKPVTPAVSPMPPYTPRNAEARCPALFNDNDLIDVQGLRAFNESLTSDERYALFSVTEDLQPLGDRLRAGLAVTVEERSQLEAIDKIFDGIPSNVGTQKLYGVMLRDDFDTLFSGQTSWIDSAPSIASMNKIGQAEAVSDLLNGGGFVASELMDVEIQLEGVVLPLWRLENFNIARREVMIPRGSHYAIISQSDGKLVVKVTTPGRKITAPPAPKPIPKIPMQAKVTEVPRRKVGHLTTGWKVPRTVEEFQAFDAELKAHDITVDSGTWTFGLGHQVSESALPLFIKQFERIQKDLGMSPIEFNAHVFSKTTATDIKSVKGMFIFRNDETFKYNAIITHPNNEKASITRQFRKGKNGGLAVHHDYFKIHERYQGGGLAKQVSSSILSLYDHLDIRLIDMLANIDVGGYAWARYGFLPEDVAEWKSMLYAARNRIKSLKGGSANFSSLLNQMDAAELTKVESLIDAMMDAEDVTHVRVLSGFRHPLRKRVRAKDADGNQLYEPNGDYKFKDVDTTLGKEILLGTTWKSEMDLTNPIDYSIYRTYID